MRVRQNICPRRKIQYKLPGEDVLFIIKIYVIIKQIRNVKKNVGLPMQLFRLLRQC